MSFYPHKSYDAKHESTECEDVYPPTTSEYVMCECA